MKREIPFFREEGNALTASYLPNTSLRSNVKGNLEVHPAWLTTRNVACEKAG